MRHFLFPWSLHNKNLPLLFVVLVFGFSSQLYAQLSLEIPTAGAKEIKGQLSAAANGIEIQVNKATVNGATNINQESFVVTITKPLAGGDTVRAREIIGGKIGAWSDFVVVPDTSNTTVEQSGQKSVKCSPQLSFSPGQLTFGKQPWGTDSQAQTVTLTNNGATEVKLGLEVVPKTTQSFKISQSSCASPLASKGSCTFQVIYSPDGSFKTAMKGKVINAITPDDNSACAESNKSKSLTNQVETAAKAVVSATQAVRLSTDVGFENALKQLDEEVAGTMLSGTPEHWKYPFTRAVAGLDVSAPSSRTVKQAYFIEFNLLAPLGSRTAADDPLESTWWGWLNPRLTSLPQATNPSALSTINAAGGFLDDLKSSGTVKDIAQGIDVSGGLELALLKPRRGIGWWAEYPNTKARLGISLIAGGGVSTPFSVDNTDLTSQVNQSICDAFNKGTIHNFDCAIPSGETRPVITGPDGNKKFITFVTPERSRFYRRFYTGIRLKTFFFNTDLSGTCSGHQSSDDSDKCETPYNIFPGIIDISAGKDEAVTGGKMNTWLFRVESSYPLPFYQGIHLFGSIYTAFGKERATPPFNSIKIDSPADSDPANDANTLRFPVPPLTRDYYRIGIGVDLIQVFKKADKGGQPQSAANTQK